MKIITLLAVLAVVLVDVFGSKSSVGGPMTDWLVSVLVMLAVGFHQSASNKRGPLRFLANIVLAIVGGMVGLWVMSIALEAAMDLVHFQGKLATSNHPLRYIADVAMPLFTVLGSWMAIQIVDRTVSLIANSGTFHRSPLTVSPIGLRLCNKRPHS